MRSAEEVILQRADVILGQRKRNGVLHAEEGVMVLPVVAVWKLCAFAGPGAWVAFGKALIINGIAVAAELRVHIRIRHAIQRPEIVCENMCVRCVQFRGWVEELLQTADRLPVHAGRGKRVGIAHPGEGQRAVFKGSLSFRRAVVEQIGRNKPFIVNDFSV